MEPYKNSEYEREIEETFEKALSLVSKNRSRVNRRLEFNALFSSYHQGLFNKYSDEIDSTEVYWGDYDGNVSLTYRHFRAIKHTEYKFFIAIPMLNN